MRSSRERRRRRADIERARLSSSDRICACAARDGGGRLRLLCRRQSGAVYDDAVVTQALGRKHYVAFFALDGALTPDDGTRRALAALAQSARGADKDGVRVSVESAALSVAFDPQRVPLAEMQRALARKFAAKKLTVLPLRVLEAPGKLKPVEGR